MRGRRRRKKIEKTTKKEKNEREETKRRQDRIKMKKTSHVTVDCSTPLLPRQNVANLTRNLAPNGDASSCRAEQDRHGTRNTEYGIRPHANCDPRLVALTHGASGPCRKQLPHPTYASRPARPVSQSRWQRREEQARDRKKTHPQQEEEKRKEEEKKRLVRTGKRGDGRYK